MPEWTTMASLFVSHSSHDRDEAERVAKRLRVEGFAALFLDFDPAYGISAGRDWERELYAQLRKADGVIFLASAASVASQWCFAEITLARSLGKPVFPLRLEAGVRLGLLDGVQWIGLSEGETAFASLWAGLRQAGLDPANAFARDPLRSPYPGLEPFAPEDAGVFFGRDYEVGRLLELLQPTLQRGVGRFVAVVGPSGSGKSSLLRAGLLPRVERLHSRWIVVPPMRPGRHPTRNLARSLTQAFATYGSTRSPAELKTFLDRGPDGLVELATELADLSVNGDGEHSVLVVVDQTEELLTRSGVYEQQAFLGLLNKAMGADSPLWVVATIRSEFLSTAPDRAGLAEVVDDPLVVEPLSRERLPEVIQRPAQRAGIEFAPGLVERMVDETTGGDALPLLAYTLRELYQRAQLDGRITIADYEAVGGVVGALRGNADRLADELDRRGQGRLVMPTLLQLATVEGDREPTRRRVLRSALGEDQQTVVDAFVDARLLTSNKNADGQTTIEVAHEALLRQWRPLREAIEAARTWLRRRSELERLAIDWDQGGRDESYLLRGGRLGTFNRWTEEHDTDLGPLERQFLEASRALAAKELAAARRRRRRLRYGLLSAALALLLVMSTAIVALALNARSAQRATLLAEHRALLAQYETKLDSDPAASLNFALQAWHTARRAQGALRADLEAQAEAAVRTALEADNHRLVLGATTSEFSPDGSALLTAGSDGMARLFDATTGHLKQTFKPSGTESPPALLRASGSDDGKMVLTTAADSTVRVYDLATGRDVGILTRAARAMWGTMAGHPVVLTFGDFSTAKLWDPRRPRKIREFGNRTVEAALSPDGRHVLTVDHAKGRVAINVWDAASGHQVQTSPPVGFSASEARFVAAGWHKVVFRAKDTPNSSQVMLWDWRNGSNALRTHSKSRLDGPIAVSKDGRFFAAAVDKHVTVFDAGNGRPIGEISDQANGINAVDLSADGSWLVTGGSGGKALVWNARRFNSQPIAGLLGHGWGISGVQFDPSTPWRITTASRDGTARTWELAPRTDLTAGLHRMLDTDISRDGQLLVTAADNGDLRIYKRRVAGANNPWSQVAHNTLPAGGLGSAQLTPDGRTVVSARLGDVAPSVWVWQSGNPLRRLSSSSRILTALAISGDGGSIAAGDKSNRVTVWDLASGGITARLQLGGDGHQITGVRYIPQSTLVAAASTDGTIRLFDPTKFDQPSRTLGEVGDPPVHALDISPDGAYLATASEDRNLRVWRILDGTLKQSVAGPPTNTDVAFSPNGKRVALATADAAVHIWEWQENHKLAVLRRHGDSINSIQFTPDGNNIITASDDSTVAIFACTTCQQFDELLKKAEAQDRRGQREQQIAIKDLFIHQLVRSCAEVNRYLAKVDVKTQPGVYADQIALYADQARHYQPRPKIDREQLEIMLTEIDNTVSKYRAAQAALDIGDRSLADEALAQADRQLVEADAAAQKYGMPPDCPV
jgi:WD40 repeat protein